MFFRNVVLLSFLVAMLCTVESCDTDSGNERFIRTYTNVLIAREKYPDNAVADFKVDSIINGNGFTKESFKKTYMELSRNPEEFRAMMDSVHAIAQREARR